MPSILRRRCGSTLLLSILAVPLFLEEAAAQPGIPGSWCVLRRHNIFEPPECFEFYLCDATRDWQRCSGAGVCSVGPLGLREGWLVDPVAHPADNPAPYSTWEGGDYVMSVLSRYQGNWYQCRGPRTMEMPRRILARDGPSEPGWCVLRKPIPFWPPNCFEFYLAAAGAGRAIIVGGVCFVTTLAARENWEIDPTLGGPYFNRGEGSSAMDTLDRFRGNLYGCFPEGLAQPTPPSLGQAPAPTPPVFGQPPPPVWPDLPQVSPAGTCSERIEACNAECQRIARDCVDRNCGVGPAPNYSGCKLDCNGCPGHACAYTYTDYWCALHPSYLPAAESNLTQLQNDLRQCNETFLADAQPGRIDRNRECGGKAGTRFDQEFSRITAEACRAHCAESGKEGLIQFQPYRCECR